MKSDDVPLNDSVDGSSNLLESSASIGIKSLSKNGKAKTLPDSYFAGPCGSTLIGIGLDSVKSLLNESVGEMDKYMEATKLPVIQCKMCKFTADSLCVLNYHYETPHFKRSKYRCNFCSEKSVNAQDVVEHMQVVHGVDAHVEQPMKQYQCKNCTFSGTQKGQLRRHLVQCEAKFKLEQNLAPPAKFDLPAYLPSHFSQKNKRLAPKEDDTKKASTDEQLNVMKCSGTKSSPTSLEQELESSIVECEICDGYVRNMDSLYKHIKVAHTAKVSKEKILKKKTTYSCKKCELSFYTEIGLERHYLGSHGLVTKKLERAFHKSEDGGYCPLCGNHYDSGLVDHVAKEHHLQLEVINISYRCKDCGETFTFLKTYNDHARVTHSSILPVNKIL